MAEFTHLHLHTEYSLLDGYARIDRLFQQVKALGMDSVAITDHGVMFGVLDFYQAAKKHGIHPIIGCEVYTSARSMYDKDAVLDKSSGHLVLLAETQEGYQNLIQIVSQGFVEGFYYKPRVDKALLKKHAKGLIALSSCLAGDIPQAILYGNLQEARRLILEYKSLFGPDHFFLELQDHNLPEQKKVNIALMKLSKELHVPLVATNDVHYIHQTDSVDHDVLLCIQTGKTLSDTNRMRFPNDQFYLKSPEEMAAKFHYVEEALTNTMQIARRCHVTFDFETLHMPQYNLPPGKDAKTLLTDLCHEGVKKRYNHVTQAIMDRMHYELSVIIKMGYEDYFLIVWDFIKYARENNILVGPGRGSGGGSLVAFALRITDVDPMAYGLIFERFLNPERITMPDFDIDFQDDRRQEVIDYVISKYGQDRVAQIITFGTMGARAAIRDVGRVMGINYGDVDRVAKAIPFGIGITIDQALSTSRDLSDMVKANNDIHQLIQTAKSLEGMPRHASTHAAGVVIAKNAVQTYVPLYLHDQSVTTQFNMNQLEQLGLLKMDFLGLRTLTVLGHALELIKETHGQDLDLLAIDFEDEKTYDLLASGQTLGIFQLESSGMRRFLRELKASTFEDIIAGISLYRPGPMDSIPKYVKNKLNPQAITYVAEALKPILDVTYGCLVYQEQVMEIVRVLGGYSYGRSDLVRRAMSKKKMDVMEKERQLFIHGLVDDKGQVVIPGCMRNGLTKAQANTIFDDMIDFAKYAFNKSHAAGYAIIAYQTAYLKAHFPVAFMAAQMTSVMGSHTKVAQYMGDCKDLKIEVLPPDVRYSEARFTVDDGQLRFGLLAIKNVGRGIIESIIKARKQQPFTDFQTFLSAIETRELNKKAIESLIKAGACDGFGIYRARLLGGFEKLIDGIMDERRRNVEGQLSLLGEEIINKSGSHEDAFPKRDEFSLSILLNFEKETMGIYLSGHPLDPFVKWMDEVVTIRTSELIDDEGQPDFSRDNEVHTLAGMVIRTVEKATKNGKFMGFITLEDVHGSVEVIIFPKHYDMYHKLLKTDTPLIVKGRITLKEDDDPKMIAEAIYPLTEDMYLKLKRPSPQQKEGKVFIRLDRLTPQDQKLLVRLSNQYKGHTQVIVYESLSQKRIQLKNGVQVTQQLMTLLTDRYGEKNVVVKS